MITSVIHSGIVHTARRRNESTAVVCAAFRLPALAAQWDVRLPLGREAHD